MLSNNNSTNNNTTNDNQIGVTGHAVTVQGVTGQPRASRRDPKMQDCSRKTDDLGVPVGPSRGACLVRPRVHQNTNREKAFCWTKNPEYRIWFSLWLPQKVKMRLMETC